MSPAVALFMILLSGPVSAQDNVFTPQHVAKLRIVTAAVISPDGTQVAYLLSVPRQLPREKDGPSWSELHVVDTKGNSTPFITGEVRIGDISWTPDGKSIAYLAKRDKDETRCLYTIGGKGGESKRILTHATDITGYSFSGDGQQIAFLATEPVAKAKKTQQDQGFTQEIYEEDQPLMRVWIAPLAVSREDASPPADAGGSPRMLKLPGSASELHFNPKEDKIAVALAPNALIDESLMFRKVHIVDLKTGKATNLENPGKMGQVAWSPEGTKLAIISGADKNDPREGRIWIYEKVWQKVKMIDDLHVDSIAWTVSKKDETDVVEGVGFLSSNGVKSRIGAVGPVLKGKAPITGAELQGITFEIKDLIATNLSFGKSTTQGMAFISHKHNHLPEVYFVGAGDKMSAAHRLTDSNPWLKDMKLAKQEIVKYQARDGLELEGILIRPLNEEKGKRYPLVLTVHGGPEAHYSNGWLTNYNMLGQVAAARGMAVFYPNYRGSTGYGVEFSMKGQAAAGGKEFDDLVDGVDHLVKMGLVDTKKVGITGGSYGGYATAWGSTYYSDRFAAGVMFVGVSDWISCSGTTDIPQEMYLVHHRKWLWEDWDYFAKSSPIYHVEKSKTPLLILHGKNDPRVHPSQSLELYRHLKVRGKAPVRLVLYPGEGHGNARAASRYDYNLRLLQWMEHYLKGPGGAMPPMELDYGLPAAGPAAKGSALNWDTRDHSATSAVSAPWMGRGCPCCIGW
jgi:dipeptidyl aminopeptidase/acylaminoacyl peptidase